MNILSIDTSTKTFSLAVVRGGKVVVFKNIKLKKVLSSSIMPAMDTALKKARLGLKKVDGFAVGLGPGSFTSLRVGLATVKALSFATQRPIVGICSLDVLALAAARKAKGPICVVSDARRDLVYACLYEAQNGNIKQKNGYLLTPINELLKKIKKPTTFTGDGIKLFGKEIKERLGTDVRLIEEEKYWHPDARDLAVLAKERFDAKKFDDADSIVPVYLYPDDCQVQK